MRLARLGLALLALAVGAGTARAVEAVFESQIASPRHRQAIERSRELLRGVLELYPGTTVAVAVDDEIVWSAGFGFADVRRKAPVSSRTQFRIHQISECLTATAALRLAEEGRLDLESPVQRHVPSFPEKGAVITPRLLAAHLSGIREFNEEERAGRRHCASLEEAVRSFAGDPLARHPESAFLHSGPGYALLSAVVAGAGGQRFSEVIEEQILRPAGMTGTALEDARGAGAARSSFYERVFLGILRLAPPVDTSCWFGAGGYLSTAEDLARFGMRLLGGELLRRETLPLLFTPQRTRRGESTGHGLGFQVAMDAGGRRRLLQNGRTAGGRSALVLVPEARIAVALLANIEGEHLDDHAGAIATYFLELD